jgi:diguanylate cyclase (GGDEF)-like protein/PAS domain S-box-containing protein
MRSIRRAPAELECCSAGRDVPAGVHSRGALKVSAPLVDLENVGSPARHGLQAEQTIARADAAADAALRELPDALVIAFDTDMRFILTAGQPIERLGSPRAYQEGQPVAAAFPREMWDVVGSLFESALTGETRSREIWTTDERCITVDVGPLRLNDAGRVEEGANIVGGMAVVLDSTARRAADLVARGSGDGFEQIFDRSPVGTGLLDREGRWLLVNRALCEITGYTAEELIGKRFDGIIHPEDTYNDSAQREQLLAGDVAAYRVEKRYFDASGETVLAILSVSLVRDSDGAPLHYIAQLQDISERREFEEQLRSLADHDPLTGLRNRRLFLYDLHLQVARSRRYGEIAGLMVVDLDGMRELNVVHGHDAGDAALQAVARALTRRLRQTDLIARMGGDEFAVLLPHIDEEGLAVVAEVIGRVIPTCAIDIGDSVVHPAVSIGFTIVDEHAGSSQEALTAAARAMRTARRSGPPPTG